MTIELTADLESDGEALDHYWNTCVGAGRANEGLRATWQEQLSMAVEECDFEYIRFHGLFHDDMFVYWEEDGEPVYNWQYVDALFDRLLEIGIRPFVEFGFTPKDMASGDQTVFWWESNVTPPADVTAWADLVERAVRHWVDRYGIAEVKEWYFEVWNEPNLPPFFSGTKSEYFEMYEHSVERIKSIDERLPVGGPATSNFVPDDRFAGEREDTDAHVTHDLEDLDDAEWEGVWIEDFLAFCETNDVPLDFVSTHPYPTDFALDSHGETRGRTRSVDSTRQDLTWLREVVDDSAFPDAEIHLTEWNSSPSPHDCSHDYLPAATYVVKTNLDASGLVDSLAYWVFTDVFEEHGGDESAFHGGFGLVNFQGIVKPTYHAYRFLSALGDRELAREDGCIVTRDAEGGSMAALAYNYPDEQEKAIPISEYPDRDVAEETQATGTPKSLSLTVSGFDPDASVVVETLDTDHGAVIEDWTAMGQPQQLDREQAEHLRSAARATKTETIGVDAAGTLELERTLEPWSLVSIRELE